MATDGDKDRPQNIVYFLTGQGIDPDNPSNSKFDINRTTGEIFVLKVSFKLFIYILSGSVRKLGHTKSLSFDHPKPSLMDLSSHNFLYGLTLIIRLINKSQNLIVWLNLQTNPHANHPVERILEKFAFTPRMLQKAKFCICWTFYFFAPWKTFRGSGLNLTKSLTESCAVTFKNIIESILLPKQRDLNFCTKLWFVKLFPAKIRTMKLPYKSSSRLEIKNCCDNPFQLHRVHI